MKTLPKIILVAGAFLATFASSQAAPVTLHITGSTAYRSAVHNAISHILTNPVAAYNGSSLSTATQAVFQGTMSGVSGTVTIETNWTGSISAIAAIANNTSIPGFNTTTTGYANGYGWMSASNIPGSGASVTPGGQSGFSSSFGLSPGPGGGAAISSASIVADSVSTADVGLSDCFQASTPFSVAKGYPNVEPSGSLVGIVPFVFVKNCANTSDTDYANGTWSRITNITSNQAKFLYSGGYCQAFFLTGNSSDVAYLSSVGSDIDSGTRLDALAETGIGIYTDVDQYVLAITGGNNNAGVGGTITNGSTLATAGLTATLSPGAGGESTSSMLALKLATPGSDAGGLDIQGYFIGYLNVADADSLLSPSGTPPSGYKPGAYLTFNGVACNLANITNGTYQLWAYEHYLTRPSGDSPALSSDQTTVSNALEAELISTDAAVAGLKTSQVGASKNVEGATIVP